MAGTVVITEETYGTMKKITWAWTCDASGNVTGTGGQTAAAFSGAAERLVTVPGAAGAAPSDNYTVTVLDEDSTDILMGAALTNRDTANTEQILASSLGVVANDKLTLNIAAAGNAKSGTVYLYLR